MKPLKLILTITTFCILTILTQVGGIIFLISLLAFGLINIRFKKPWISMLAKILSFVSLYIIFSFLVIPLIVKPLGRVRLPIFEDRHLRPANVWTFILNRNYVNPSLRTITYKVAEQMNLKYPGFTINYLDANFPFLDQFPLLPHLSHHDGKKLDLSFQYNDSQTGKMTSDVPSSIGYGICEETRVG